MNSGRNLGQAEPVNIDTHGLVPPIVEVHCLCEVPGCRDMHLVAGADAPAIVGAEVPGFIAALDHASAECEGHCSVGEEG